MISVLDIWISVISQHPDNRETVYSNVLFLIQILNIFVMAQMMFMAMTILIEVTDH